MGSPKHWLTGIALVALLLAFPVATYFFGSVFYLAFATRILILASAVVSLNLILGYGGLLSLCHATFVGLGAYIVGIGSFHASNDGIAWMANGFVQLGAILILCSVVAAIIGVISLRTRGIHFLMITMALGQIVYLAAVGADLYGGDQGLTIDQPSVFVGAEFRGRYVMYTAAAAFFCLSVLVVDRLACSRFGLVLRATKMNEARVSALGYDPVHIRLVAFIIAGAMAGLAGFLLANNAGYVSPVDLGWTRSAEMIIMLVLGGLGLSLGPLFGAAFFLIAEEVASNMTQNSPIIVGAMILFVALFMPRGLGGLSPNARRLIVGSTILLVALSMWRGPDGLLPSARLLIVGAMILLLAFFRGFLGGLLLSARRHD